MRTKHIICGQGMRIQQEGDLRTEHGDAGEDLIMVMLAKEKNKAYKLWI